MNFSTSGWSALRITILAARRVLPPDLMTPAKASKPFMNESGPDARPPPGRAASFSRHPESVEPRQEEKRPGRAAPAGKDRVSFGQRGGVRAGARAPLEEHAFGLAQIE